MSQDPIAISSLLPATRFPALTTAPENTFAHQMMTKVFPELVEELLNSGLVERERVPRLARLRRSLLSNSPVPKLPRRGMKPRKAWRATTDFVGRPWVGLPSYQAESLFYCQLLDSLGYFDPKSRYWGLDPFLRQKCAGLDSGVDGGDLGRLTEELTVRELLLRALWGNLSDEVHIRSGNSGSSPAGHEPLLVDESAKAAEVLESSHRVAIVADNAGTELVADLMLAHKLLRRRANVVVTVYLKQRPYFVSDATLNDFQSTIVRLASEYVGLSDLQEYMNQWRLRPISHWFFHSPLQYADLPSGLAGDIASHEVVIFKGDLNYRRLLSDLLTPPSTDLRTLLPNVSTNILILRTLKSDVCAGLPPDLVELLDSTDAEWRFSGKYGVVHLVGRGEVADGAPGDKADNSIGGA